MNFPISRNRSRVREFGDDALDWAVVGRRVPDGGASDAPRLVLRPPSRPRSPPTPDFVRIVRARSIIVSARARVFYTLPASAEDLLLIWGQSYLAAPLRRERVAHVSGGGGEGQRRRRRRR